MFFNDLIFFLQSFFHSQKLLSLLYAAGLIFLGYIVAKRLSSWTQHVMRTRFSRHQILLIDSVIFYGVFGLFIISGLEHIGFNLSVLLGAAGVFTVAISFASQTAASNLISGIFLLFEHPFKVGDSINVKGTSGVVDSIGFLSTKLRTSDNTLIRIPNEMLIKSEIINLSYFPTRRLEVSIQVANDNDVENVKMILSGLMQQMPQILKDPPPVITVESFSQIAICFKLTFWTNTVNVAMLTASIQDAIHQLFKAQHIILPSPNIWLNDKLSTGFVDNPVSK